MTKLLKLKWHINAYIKKVLFKILFSNRVYFGKGTTFRNRFNIYVEKDAEIIIGKDCFFNHDCSITALKKVVIGEGCIFGESVKIYDHNHRFSDADRRIKDQGYTKEEVVIGNHCWIGSNVVLLKGCKIGDNCVIGAGSIINEEIPRSCIVTAERKLTMVTNKK